MNAAEIREFTDEELVEALVDAKEERFNLRFQVATNQLDNIARLTDVKRDIARILTIMREREMTQTAAGVPNGATAVEASKESA
jgi:large subunit ribosomal protein L29